MRFAQTKLSKHLTGQCGVPAHSETAADGTLFRVSEENIMTSCENHIQFLKELPPAEFDREVRQEITDSLQDLVARVERALPLEGDTLHACVIDDFHVHSAELKEQECQVRFSFVASARHGVPGSGHRERIAGRADTAIDTAGHVDYRGVVFGEEPAFVSHDLGGGD